MRIFQAAITILTFIRDFHICDGECDVCVHLEGSGDQSML